MLADANTMDGFEFCQLEVEVQRLLVHALVFTVLLVDSLLDPLAFADLFDLDLFPCEMLKEFSGDPLIVPSIQGLVMDVVLIAVLILLISGGIVYKSKRVYSWRGGS